MIHHFLFIILLCFPFLIFVFTLSSVKKDTLLRSLGYTFIIPFYFIIFSLTLLKEIPPLEVILFIELTHMLIFFFYLIKEPKGKSYFSYSLIYGVIALLSALFIKYGFVGPIQQTVLVSRVLIGILVLNALVLWIRKNNEKGLATGLVFIILSNILSYLVKNEALMYIVVILKAFGFLRLYIHFNSSVKKRLTLKMNEAETLKKSLIESYNKDVERKLFTMQLKQERLMLSTHFDPMTQAYNKKAILEVLDSLISLGTKPLSVLMVDIDHFKWINDSNGHLAGDECIKNIVNLLQSNLRKVDYIGRYGGDEFLIILPSTNLDDGKKIAEKLRLKVSQVSSPKVTISVGLSCYPENGATAVELIEKADNALYSAKRKGRNMVSCGT